ncbi:MAG: orotidine-5'-phosphate decarboxylase [Ignavibacteriaceae bacterium]|nr:orotidine-5'-phosphate decarboxylase [Ignavibacteriaceae bacterium]
MKSIEKFYYNINSGRHVCVGLDTDFNKIPEFLKHSDDPVFEFNKIIIEKLSPFVAAFKLNFAFYEALGQQGFLTLEKTVRIIPENVFTIADAKRGDIGNTSQMYAKSVFDYLKFDSVTVNPYMGEDSISPFLNYNDKLSFVLALTSNPGSKDFEKLTLKDGEFLYQKVINKVKEWNKNKNCGIVFGATNFSELKNSMTDLASLPLLIPGVGAQGGSLNEIVKLMNQVNHNDFIINVSRSVLYKSNGEDFAEAALSEMLSLNEQINNPA